MVYELTLVIPCQSLKDPGLHRLVASIKLQTLWRAGKVEVLVSTEGTSEEARTRGILAAQGEIIGLVDADNELLGLTFLEELVAAARAPGVVGAYPGHYAWMQEDPALNRYFALLGANDPLCWWLGKADRHSCLEQLDGDSRLVRHAGQLPSLGANGFFAKREVLQHFARLASAHTDVCALMQEAGYDTYAVTPHVLWHHTGDSFIRWLRRRYHYATQLYFQSVRRRHWRMVDTPRDWLLTAGFALASCLLLPHLWVSLRGYRRVRDPAWFLHPVACLGLTCVYGAAVVVHCLRSLMNAAHGQHRRVHVPAAGGAGRMHGEPAPTDGDTL